jgi:hypothetical protein
MFFGSSDQIQAFSRSLFSLRNMPPKPARQRHPAKKITLFASETVKQHITHAESIGSTDRLHGNTQALNQ